VTTGNATINVKAALITGLIVIGCAAGLAMLSGLKGPFSRCVNYGGQMLVGPGGETSCINGRTFLPVEGFEASPR